MDFQQMTQDMDPRLAHQAPAFSYCRRPRFLNFCEFISHRVVHELPSFLDSDYQVNAEAFVISLRPGARQIACHPENRERRLPPY
jgi:hypothetical protein